jgi:hypothetical protein
MMSIQAVLRIAGEGGDLVIYRRNANAGVAFKLVTTDHTPELLDEEPLTMDFGWVDSFASAIAQIRWPWHCLRPLEVHPDFGDEVYKLKCLRDAAQASPSRNAARWKKLCGVKS